MGFWALWEPITRARVVQKPSFGARWTPLWMFYLLFRELATVCTHPRSHGRKTDEKVHFFDFSGISRASSVGFQNSMQEMLSTDAIRWILHSVSQQSSVFTSEFKIEKGPTLPLNNFSTKDRNFLPFAPNPSPAYQKRPLGYTPAIFGQSKIQHLFENLDHFHSLIPFSPGQGPVSFFHP